MSVGDYRRRLDKLTEALSASSRGEFWPSQVLTVIYSKHWRGEESMEERAELADQAVARQGAVDQVCEWVAEDARQHGYDLPYALALSFYADDPVHCMLRLPWREDLSKGS
jgi:hypothetical protein